MRTLIKRWLIPTHPFWAKFWKWTLALFITCVSLSKLSIYFEIEASWLPVDIINNIGMICLGLFIASKMTVDPNRIKPEEIGELTIKDIILRFLK